MYKREYRRVGLEICGTEIDTIADSSYYQVQYQHHLDTCLHKCSHIISFFVERLGHLCQRHTQITVHDNLLHYFLALRVLLLCVYKRTIKEQMKSIGTTQLQIALLRKRVYLQTLIPKYSAIVLKKVIQVNWFKTVTVWGVHILFSRNYEEENVRVMGPVVKRITFPRANKDKSLQKKHHLQTSQLKTMCRSKLT